MIEGSTAFFAQGKLVGVLRKPEIQDESANGEAEEINGEKATILLANISFFFLAAAAFCFGIVCAFALPIKGTTITPAQAVEIASQTLQEVQGGPNPKTNGASKT